MSMRRCSVCGLPGHDARNCPVKKASEPRDRGLFFKVDGLTPTEAERLEFACKRAKNRIAPDGRGTSETGKSRDLPALFWKKRELLGD